MDNYDFFAKSRNIHHSSFAIHHYSFNFAHFFENFFEHTF